MKITKYKKRTNGKYSAYLDDGREFIFYEEVILKYNLLLTKEINDLDEINNTNLEYDVYYVGLNSLRSRIKSSTELKRLLLKKEYPAELVDMTIEKLTKQGYLNDLQYTKSFIHYQITSTNHGPNRIRKELNDKGISTNMINDNLIEFDEDIQKEKINKLINVKLKGNNSRSGYALRNNIKNYLLSLGYDYSIIDSVLSNYSFKVDNSVVKKEYDKLKKKYSNKYSGDILERKIKEKLYLKGMAYEEE